MSSLGQIESKAPSLVCPDCGTCSVTLHMRCDLQTPECLTVATCHHCHRQFDADSLPTYRERYAVSHQAAASPCPSCGTARRALQWTCSRSTRTCHIVVTCETCGDSEAA